MKEKTKLKVRTRFAPSPTGELHIGGARTILFNYLFAKKNSGKFLLRIEDTDIKRNQEKFVSSLYEDLLWLGLKPDESIFQEGEHGPYRQIKRLEIYRKYINKLVEEKKVYYCFCSSEELVQEKEDFIKRERTSNYQYSRKCLSMEKEEILARLQKNSPYVLRFKVLREKNYSFHDLVRGEVNFQGKDIEDFVLFRQNGIPNYNFACVIDDYLMKISHVLRSEEHLSNTGKQLVLYEAFEWKEPLFGHISIILNKEKKKLSKRDKEASQWQLISQLREKGYLPEAIINYLLFLGWHPGNGKTQEIFSLGEATEIFDLKGLHSRGAVFSLEKLNWYNNYYLQKLSKEKFQEKVWEILQKNYHLTDNQKEYVWRISYLFRPQLNYFQELVKLSGYFFQESITTDGLSNDEEITLKNTRKKITELNDWEEEKIRNILQQTDKKKIFPLLRRKLTGQVHGPELSKIIYLLGKDVVTKRLN